MDIVSYTLAKQYTDKRNEEQKLKVAKVERELDNYKATMQQININQEATQKMSGYGIVNLPKNAAEGQVSGVELKGLTATNLVKNGDFSNDTEWFSEGSCKIKITDGDLELYNAAGTPPNVRSTSCYGKAGDKIYITAIAKPSSETTVVDIRYRDHNADIATESRYFTIDNDTEVFLSDVITLPSDSYSGGPQVIFRHSDIPTESCFVKSKSMMAINLTETFGAGNEPTVEECDEIFANWFEGTKSTVSAMRLKSVGKNLLEQKIYPVGSNVTVQNNGDSYLFSWTGGFDAFVSKKDGKIPVSRNTNMFFCVKSKYISAPLAIRIIGADGNDLINSGLSVSTSYTENKRTFNTGNNDYIIIKFVRSGSTTGSMEVKEFQLGISDFSYEPYTESTQYITAKDDEGKIVELRSLPNGTKDEINVTDRKLIKRIGEKSNIANGMEIDFADMAEGGTYYAWNEDGETETGIKGDTLGIDATTLIYQLAEPVEMPVQVSGTLLSYPSGTVYVENVVADAGLYSDGIIVLHQDLPIKSIEKISKIDYETGLETILDASKAVIASDKLSFTHPDLSEGDIVFFEYEYDVESTDGEAEVEFYDSRYVVKDTETGKFYKWNIVVANGQPSIELVEV